MERLLQEMRSATASLSGPELLHLRIAPGKWSAAEILEHLTLAFTTTTALMRKVTAGAVAVAPATLKQRIAAFVVLDLQHMPTGRQAPEFTRPTGAPLDDIRDRFQVAVSEMDAALDACQRAHPDARKIASHPILGPFTIAEWRRFHLVHVRHHMAQIRIMRRIMNKAAWVS